MAEKSVISSADEELPALFWDTSPGEDNPDQAALQALDEETTSDEKAESFKVCTSCISPVSLAEHGCRCRSRPVQRQVECSQPTLF